MDLNAGLFTFGSGSNLDLFTLLFQERDEEKIRDRETSIRQAKVGDEFFGVFSPLTNRGLSRKKINH